MILLLILKWILIIVLIILAIILILSLFSITYDIDASKNIKDIKAKIDIKYLYGLLRFKGSYKNNNFLYNMRILFFTLNDLKAKKKPKKYKEEYASIEEKNNLDYIFDDKDEFLTEDEKNKLEVSRALAKNQKSISKITAKEKNKNKKKKGFLAKIISLLKERNHKTLKELFDIIKEIITLIKPEKTKIKFTLLTFSITLNGRIRIINLIIILIRILMRKKTRDFLLN